MAGYQKQLAGIGFGYDALTAKGYNKINGVCFTVDIHPNTKDCIVTAACRPTDETAVFSMRQAIQQFAAERKKIIKNAAFDGKQITIVWYMADINPNIAQYVTDSVNFVSYCIGQFGCIPCCSSCGNESYADICVIENNIAALCENCFYNTQSQLAGNMYRENQVVTNYPMGVLGSVLGGLGGAVLWVITSMLGKISIVAGLFAGMFGYLGFKKFGKKMTLSGLIISLIVSFVFLLAGMYFAIGVDLFNALKEYEFTFSEAFELIPVYLTDPDATGEIIYNHIFGFLSFIVGAVICIAGYYNDKKVKNRMIKLM